MPMFSSSEVARLDNSNPELERAGAFARMAYSPVIITYQISDDATGNPTAFTAPFAMRVVDIIVEGQATAGGATVAFAKNSTTMCTAIACEADGTVSRLAAGAVAVDTPPAQLKKSRPGILLTVMCREKDRDTIIRLLFRHTTTLGVRESISRRYTLSRSFDAVITEYGQVRKKISSGFGVTREKYEFEDLARIARDNNMSLADVKKMCDLM